MGEENRSSSGSSTVMIVVAILGGILLLGCCGGVVVLGGGALMFQAVEVKDEAPSAATGQRLIAEPDDSPPAPKSAETE